MSKVCIFNLVFHKLIQLNVIDSWLLEIVDNYWCLFSYGTSFDTSYDTSYGTSYDTSYGTFVLNAFLPPVMDSLQSWNGFDSHRD
jgi:hypothetical protein